MRLGSILFFGSIEDINQVGDFMEIQLLSVNGKYFKTHVISKDVYYFRIVLELWIFNESLKEFQFSWSYGDDSLCVWNQIWFNTTLTYS